jgi:anaerobic ribonucleoside-triphosphate reductase
LFCSKHFVNEPVIVGDEFKQEKYCDFQGEMHIFNRVLFEVMIEEDAHGHVMIFPIPIINLTKKFNCDNENLKEL